jgi:hypothetical protein
MGEGGTTLCGIPMLGNNYAQFRAEWIDCAECLSIENKIAETEFVADKVKGLIHAMPPPVLNGIAVQGWICTEYQDGKACGIVMGYDALAGSYVTAWYRCGDLGWSHGHYAIPEMADAVKDMVKRAGFGGAALDRSKVVKGCNCGNPQGCKGSSHATDCPATLRGSK